MVELEDKVLETLDLQMFGQSHRWQPDLQLSSEAGESLMGLSPWPA